VRDLQLTFEYLRDLGDGFSPQVLHRMDNALEILYITQAGAIQTLETFPAYGIYETLEFTQKGRVSTDRDIQYPALKKMAHYGGFGFWSADGDHKFVMYMLPTDISHTLENGQVSYAKDSAVSQLSLSLMNLEQALLGRHRSIISPGTALEIYARWGMTDELQIGRFYIDRVSIGYPDQGISITARNSIGKRLKEQTFNQNTAFEEPTLRENLAAILTLAGVEDFFVADPQKDWKLTFDRELSLLDGISRVVGLLPQWQISENTDGTVGIGPVTDHRFEQPGTYVFERDKTCWSYGVEYDDAQTVCKLCVHCNQPAQTIWRDLAPPRWWLVPPGKALFVAVPDGTSSAGMDGILDQLEAAVSVAGRIESFAGIFTPHLLIGDAVLLVESDESTRAIGTVTAVRHGFGKDGFYTEFTADSAGRTGKPFLKDLVGMIAGQKKGEGVVIS
jgi:hypothetical protein